MKSQGHVQGTHGLHLSLSNSLVSSETVGWSLRGSTWGAAGAGWWVEDRREVNELLGVLGPLPCGP